MRLNSIKLAGFKSFVDPTTVNFRSNLTAVVGPNGCGKSNVIDAVRWVMGEGSAKTLRASAMTDVIFNGSTQRQPISKASIELVFDNSDKTLQGEYANFGEISVRREVTRDAQSFYYLNGTRCRRRDITDLFLGTGLGPRSYAIIEQGMINRFIEARPEELRGYIEEAAGVSRYKERRRETETRLKRTRENLERLGDLEDELMRQLQHLRRQAEAAKRFKTLSEDIRQAEVRLAARRWGKCQSEIEAAQAQAQSLEAQIKDALVRRESVQGQIHAQRQQFDDAQQALEQAQAAYYSSGADVTRLEQQQLSIAERRRAMEQNQNRAKARLQSAQQALSQDDEERMRQRADCSQWRAQLDQLESQKAPLEQAVAEAEHAWRQAREAQQVQQQARAQCEQSLRLAQRDAQQAQKALEQVQARRQRLMSAQPIAPQIPVVDWAALERQALDAQTQADEAQAELETGRRALQAQQSMIQRLESAVREAQAQVDSLTQALASSQPAQTLDRPRILDGVEVAPDKALMLASALGSLTQAYRLEDWQLPGSAGQFVVDPPRDFDGLLGLRGARPVDSLAQAIAAQAQLAPGEFFVAPEGQQIGRGWAVLSPQLDPTPQLQAQLAQAHKQLQQAQQELAQAQQQPGVEIQELAERAESGRVAAQQLTREWEQAQAEQRANERLIQEHQRAQERFANDQAAIEQDSEEAHATLEMALEAQAEAQEAFENMPQQSSGVVELEAAWHDARDQLDEFQTQVSSITLRLQTAQARLESLEDRVQRARDDVEEASETLAELAEQAEQWQDESDLQVQLNQAVAARVEAENALASARGVMQGFDAAVRELENQRLGCEQALESLREQLAASRTEASTYQALQQSQSEFLEASGFVPQVVLDTLDTESETQLAVALEKLQKQRERTGAVNLAAVEELEEAEQRKAYYAEQRLDLETALDTLDGAIRKIDRETRALFRETFERINQSLQALFPKVFGGGEAWLEMTDEDPLETGVTLMARPPGKKNSTIHLLSGGEKALTAVALVFAIFQLNPAPFCMLDEVDAPLDDANVGRYANLLQEMSDQVQFIFVTHNKIAMEKAEHLMGVTMHEAGVSRLVSVDVAEAVAMTQ